MKILSAVVLTFLYLEIFPQQTTGVKGVNIHDCKSSISDCYTIRANLNTAKAICECKGEGLITDIDGKVLTKNGGVFYWTGWEKNEKNKFQSTDGDDFPHNYQWKYNHPVADMDCVVYDGESMKFRSLECNTEMMYTVVCDGVSDEDYKDVRDEEYKDVRDEEYKDARDEEYKDARDEEYKDVRDEEYKDVCSLIPLSSGRPTENLLRNLTRKFEETTDDNIIFSGVPQDIVLTILRANIKREITINNNIIQIGTDTFQESTTLAIHKTKDTAQLTNSSFSLSSDIITIYTNNCSTTNFKIVFASLFKNDMFFIEDKCVHLTPDGNWSPVGLETSSYISNQTIECTTNLQNISTIAVWRNHREWIIALGIVVAIISLISAFLLLSSVVIFIVSGEKFFSHDINILHLNNTLSLFIAIVSISAICLELYKEKITPECIAISFILQFLWTNVFLSSLSIAIVVFYTVWIVGISHTARKLYIYLIPIGWGVSLVWSSVCVVIKTFRGFKYCIYSKNLKLDIGWPFPSLMIVILLINATLLILSLVKIWSVLRKQNSQEGELKRLRRVAIGGILLIPALGLPFISLMAIQIYYESETKEGLVVNCITFLIVFLINAPIGIVHFVFITCQIKETILRKYCCCCRRITPAQIAHSLHLNIARKSPKAKQETPNDVIPDSVPMNEFTVCPLDSIRLVNYPNTESTVYSNNSIEPIN